MKIGVSNPKTWAVQSRHDVRIIAELHEFMTRNGYTFRSKADFMQSIVELLRHALNESNMISPVLSTESALVYMKRNGFTPTVGSRGIKKLANQIKFESSGKMSHVEVEEETQEQALRRASLGDVDPTQLDNAMRALKETRVQTKPDKEDKEARGYTDVDKDLDMEVEEPFDPFHQTSPEEDEDPRPE